MNFDFSRYGQRFEDAARDKPFVVFLCGPALRKKNRPAIFRRNLKVHLETEKFTVVLGEDDGLLEIGKQYHLNAQNNELHFLARECQAVVIIASSPGSLCELGLFSHMKANGLEHVDFIILLHKKHKDETSYINEGPINLIKLKGGSIYYVDYTLFNTEEIVNRLKSLRAIKVPATS